MDLPLWNIFHISDFFSNLFFNLGEGEKLEQEVGGGGTKGEAAGDLHTVITAFSTYKAGT